MATDIEILMKAKEKEDDPRRSKMGWKSWEFYTVGATKDDVKRLVDGGYVVVDGRRGTLTKYLITDKARKVIWANEMEQKFKAIPRETIMGSLDLVVGFDDIKEVLADTVSSRRKMNILMTGPPASIHGNTEVWVDCGDGPQPLPIASLEGITFKALAVDPFTMLSGWYDAELSKHDYGGEWVKITGLGALPFTVTATHSLVAYDPIQHRLVPKIAGNLKVGELVPILSGWTCGRTRSVVIDGQDVALDRELGFMLGFWMGDGGLRQEKHQAITFTNNDGTVLERVKIYLSGLKASGHYWKGGSLQRTSLIVQHRSLYEFLKREFVSGDGTPKIKGRTSRRKHLPGWVLSGPDEFICELLKGYFYADGTVSNGVISATTTSPMLARDMAMLLTRLNITPGVQRRGDDAQAIVIKQCDAQRFTDRVGIFRENLVNTTALTHDESFKVPFPFDASLAQSLLSAVRKGRQSQSFTRRSATRLINAGWAEQLNILLNADIRWGRVEKAEHYNEAGQTVYDLSVPGAETFVLGNRVLVHNCAKSVMLDALREAVPAPQSYIAFGSRTSAAGLSDMLFDTQPELLLFDEVDKCRSDAISVLLGLMEKGEVIETKSNRTRGIKLRTQVIAACNRQDKFTPEFLSRFAFKPHFPEYTRQEFIDVTVGMLDRAEGCPPEVARLIGVQVYDLGLGDVRAARGVWQMMHDSTPEEVNRVIRLNLKYLPDEQAEIKRKTVSKKIAIARLPGFME